MGIFNRWALKPNVSERGDEKGLKGRADEEERWKEESMDGGGRGDKVSCRVFALKDAGLQRSNEQQRSE